MQNSFDLISVTDHNGTATTTSLNIAKVFGKEHKHVLQDIQRAIETVAEVSAEATGLNFDPLKKQPLVFEETTYADSKGEVRPMYLLNRDATVFLIMGYTGKKAAKFKLGYIAAFDDMEKKLKELPAGSNGTAAPVVTDKLYSACTKLLKDYRTTNKASYAAMADLNMRAEMLTKLLGYNPIDEYEKQVKIERAKYMNGYYRDYYKNHCY